ncbi:MAG: hypothetical protein J6S14_09825 [Clostridia bacterium]|nr:hypothetical protein [Clostridia bacterium]
MKRDRMVYELISLLPEADDEAIQIVHDLLEDFVASKKNLHGEKNSLYIDVLPYEHYPCTETAPLSKETREYIRKEEQLIRAAFYFNTHAEVTPKKKSSFYPGADEDGMVG